MSITEIECFKVESVVQSCDDCCSYYTIIIILLRIFSPNGDEYISEGTFELLVQLKVILLGKNYGRSTISGLC